MSSADGARTPFDLPFGAGPQSPAVDAGWAEAPSRKGFFTDTSICIGCKACEVACKEWNGVPADGIFELLGSSYDNTGALGANTWRHVAFIEQHKPLTPRPEPLTPRPEPLTTRPEPVEGPGPSTSSGDGDRVDLGMPSFAKPGETADPGDRTDFRWLMSSDVCKHCTEAPCLDVCPTGALFRTEFGTVVVQGDVCNGCGYCIPACPYGVIERREGDETVKNSGTAQKCTLCYDRLGAGQTPACAQACPTESIQFGDVDELRERAARRVAKLHDAGVMDARLYGADPSDGVGGNGAFFLLLDEPEVYGLPPDPVASTRRLPEMWKRAGVAAFGLAAATVAAFAGRRR